MEERNVHRKETGESKTRGKVPLDTFVYLKSLILLEGKFSQKLEFSQYPHVAVLH